MPMKMIIVSRCEGMASPRSLDPGCAIPRSMKTSEQGQLIAFLRRRQKAAGVERLCRPLIEAEPAAGPLEAQAQHLGIGTGAGHSLRPHGVIQSPAMGLGNERQHMSRLCGKMRLQPLLEEALEFEWQAQE